MNKPTVLFVEDEEFLLVEFTKLLTQEGYNVLSTRDLDDAISLIENQPRIDLLLTDVQMAIGDCKHLSHLHAQGGKYAGVALARVFRRQ